MSRQPFSWQQFFLDTWYHKRWWAWLLLPLSWLFQIIASLRAYYHKKAATTLPVPVVVIGNISVGGTGKTPTVIALTRALQRRHIKVGIISRGYGSSAPSYPYAVTTDSPVNESGDEPLLIAKATLAPLVIGSDRVSAAQHLLKQYPETQIILSDDGLQHYRLPRQLEIIVLDGQRGLGNHFCLPAGPLREPARRLIQADWLLVNGGRSPHASHTQIEQADGGNDANKSPIDINLQPQGWYHLESRQRYPLQPLPWLNTQADAAIHAIAGIGNPQRFFGTLDTLGITHHSHGFDDHHKFSADDFSAWKGLPILMTEKDAIKCQAFAQPQWWALIVEIELPKQLVDSVANCIH